MDWLVSIQLLFDFIWFDLIWSVTYAEHSIQNTVCLWLSENRIRLTNIRFILDLLLACPELRSKIYYHTLKG